MMRALTVLFAAISGLFGVGCGGADCRAPDDCPFGSYCVLSVDGSRVSGSCTQDCFEASDCPSPASAASRAICDNRGQCRVVARVPRLRIRVPEPMTLVPEGTRGLRVAGEVISAASQVSLQVEAVGSEGCAGIPPVRVSLENDAGDFRELPFTVDPVPVEPGTRAIRVRASVGSASRQREIPVQVACPGCATVSIEAPAANAPVPGLILPELRGRVTPSAPVALWRVRGSFGGVFDGRLVLGTNGAYRLDRLPLFAGTNQVEVVVSGTNETRCSTFVQSAGRDRGFRAVLTWDTDAVDLDVHLVGPGGRFGDPLSDLSPRTPGTFGGRVLDDFDGLGPESLQVESLPDGVYGLIVEPVVGSGSALVRVLSDGMPLSTGPSGPRFVDADTGTLWIVGTLTVVNGAATWRALDDFVPVDAPPLNGPEQWPAYR